MTTRQLLTRRSHPDNALCGGRLVLLAIGVSLFVIFPPRTQQAASDTRPTGNGQAGDVSDPRGRSGDSRLPRACARSRSGSFPGAGGLPLPGGGARGGRQDSSYRTAGWIHRDRGEGHALPGDRTAASRAGAGLALSASGQGGDSPRSDHARRSRAGAGERASWYRARQGTLAWQLPRGRCASKMAERPSISSAGKKAFPATVWRNAPRPAFRTWSVGPAMPCGNKKRSNSESWRRVVSSPSIRTGRRPGSVCASISWTSTLRMAWREPPSIRPSLTTTTETRKGRSTSLCRRGPPCPAWRCM